MQMSFFGSIPLDYVSWDTSEKYLLLFTLIRIVFRYNNLPLRIAPAPLTYSGLFLFHCCSLSLDCSILLLDIQWNGVVFVCNFCFVCDEKVVSIWCSFFRIISECPTKQIQTDPMPLASIHRIFYQLHCVFFSWYALLVAPKRILRKHLHTQGKKESTHFDAFSIKARTKISLLLLLFERVVMDFDVILLSGAWTHAHLNFHSIYRWNQCHIKYFSYIECDCVVHATA